MGCLACLEKGELKATEDPLEFVVTLETEALGERRETEALQDWMGGMA